MMRPRRRRPEGRSRPGSEDSSERQERLDRRFLEDLEARVRQFLSTEDTELELEPMNSYKRRLVHKLAMQYKLDTESRGEEPNRSVCLIRTPESEAPKARPAPRARAWDFGVQTFPVNPGPEGIRLALMSDGSVQLYDEAEHSRVLHDRVVHSRQIRVRQGKIVTPDDPEW
jgi:hypothetical protein